ncbi:DUF1360 domain-containing protein [Streptomyces sp. Je 1-369]|uniref:DUF1360 domain-containing protein n=1 Tax=Streptomyces sp. Je 1-369 TaxID=2966192 RepID=UPI0022853E58|nr:DUF1360 domain-containing protein [Streptomyces sp. Je 1-369]WAL93747.1 DUF1360 domain-containing protein [Streptomyces sp. Je 1-369]
MRRIRGAFRRAGGAYSSGPSGSSDPSGSSGSSGSSGEEHRLAGHFGALVAFGAYTVAWGAAVRMRKVPLPERPEPWDVLFAAAATFRLGRLLSKGSVTSPLRAPFTRYEAASGPAEVSESPRGDGVKATVGELVTCPFCLSVWLTTTVTGAALLWPKATRTVTGGLSVLAAADAMQLGYDCLLQENAE